MREINNELINSEELLLTQNLSNTSRNLYLHDNSKRRQSTR
jgi:hypothetical protein